LALAWASWHFVEAPFLSLKKEKIRTNPISHP
jgi:peptidoglycan/LPS O-acetylase OafA/YrhL